MALKKYFIVPLAIVGLVFALGAYAKGGSGSSAGGTVYEESGGAEASPSPEASPSDRGGEENGMGDMEESNGMGTTEESTSE